MSKRLKPQLKKLETKNTNYKDHLIKSAPTISSVIEFDPTILISNSIIIGPEPSTRSDVDKLRELGVKQILNTALECDDSLSLNNEFKYLKLNMIDNPSAINVQDFLNKGSDFIDDAKLHSRPIYVSLTFYIAYYPLHFLLGTLQSR